MLWAIKRTSLDVCRFWKTVTLANIVDPDEMPHNQSLQCLLSQNLPYNSQGVVSAGNQPPYAGQS